MAAGMIGEGLALAVVALNPGGAVSLPAGQSHSAHIPITAETRGLARQVRAFYLPGSGREFAAAEDWSPPAKSWGTPGQGPVIELGALGSKHSWQPDLVHLSLDWNF